ncbi:MAG: riboflavin biosynthesis protein RibF [Clostridia bacterium]|nr:riboflavin biosynthesis protein RibF [Clostridia bacterium]
MNHFFLSKEHVTAGTSGRVLALGSFDGFHIGHRAVIDAAVSLASELNAEPAVFCFDIPPACFAPGSNIKVLGDPEERKDLFEARGISSLFVAGFSELRGLDARDFITEILMKKCGAIGVVCGFNFAFGKNRAGTPALLRDYFRDRVITLDPIYYGDYPVSSSRIRAAIADGEIEQASAMLGRKYAIAAPVSEGRHDGRKLGFPTLNQFPDPLRAVPAFGVYVTRTTLDDGRVFNSVTDIGLAPTLDSSGRVRIETHILDEYLDDTPKKIKVEFLKYLRGEIVFGSLDDLKAQITSDANAARRFFDTKNI